MSSVQQYSLSNIESIGKWRGKYLKEPDNDLVMGLVSMPLQKSDETVENKRFYVSDTELIERRFLKDATEEFDKDTDPFSESVLHKNVFDCALSALGIEDKIKVMSQENFMNGNSFTSVPFRDIVQCVKTDKYKVPYTVDHKIDDMSKTIILSQAMNIPIIIENTDTFMNTCVKWNSDLPIVYIRKVIDGWLSVNGEYDDLLEKGIMKEPMEKPNSGQYRYKITIRKKVNDILERLKYLKIDLKGGKKKTELVNIYCNHIAFPERFLSTIDV